MTLDDLAQECRFRHTLAGHPSEEESSLGFFSGAPGTSALPPCQRYNRQKFSHFPTFQGFAARKKFSLRSCERRREAVEFRAFRESRSGGKLCHLASARAPCATSTGSSRVAGSHGSMMR